ncbi:hypothetical protein CN285_13930 [Bacillus cereus]|nr:hypothetical protein CN285_13930 [Bacillus cereus]
MIFCSILSCTEIYNFLYTGIYSQQSYKFNVSLAKTDELDLLYFFEYKFLAAIYTAAFYFCFIV